MIALIRHALGFPLTEQAFLGRCRQAFQEAQRAPHIEQPMGPLTAAARCWIESEHPDRLVAGEEGFVLLCASLYHSKYGRKNTDAR